MTKPSSADESKAKDSVKEISFVQKELLLNSLTQRELLSTTKELNKTIKELTGTLMLLERHEYLTLHKNKWKLVAYNIFLGMLFAVGTVFGLVLLSWLTFHFFKDSAILNQIIQGQLKARQFDLGSIREKAKNDLIKPTPESDMVQTGSGTSTGSIQN